LPSAGQELEQRGFTRAVRAHHTEALVRVEGEVDAGQDVPTALVVVAGAVQLDHLVAQPGRAEHQAQLPGAGCSLGPAGHDPGGGLDARPRLPGPRRRPALQPGQLLAGQVAPRRLGDLGPLLALGPAQQVGLVPALVEVPAATVELQHPRRHPIEEVAVVGDQDQPALEVEEPLLQPGHRPDIEMVGRLVEDEQLGRPRQHRGQRDPLDLAAGKGRHIGVMEVGQTETIHGRLGLPPLPDGVRDGARRQDRLLLEVAHPAAPTAPHPTVVGVLGPGYHAEEGGLARPVDTDHAQALAIGNRDREVLEESPIGPDDGDVLEVDEHCHGSARLQAGGLPRRYQYPVGVYCGMVGYSDDKASVLKRLKRVEGQIRGLQRMVEEDTYCIDVLTQVSAASRALQSVALELLNDHLSHCVHEAIVEGGPTADEKVKEAQAAIERLVRS
jgi:DNA-binding FrmR family transcriptional regulator